MTIATYNSFVIIYKTTLILLLSIYSSLVSQKLNYNFQNFDDKYGLSNNTVNCIFQDSQGFLWIGTDNGLNRYDGYNFNSFFSQIDDTNSISNNSIYALCEDDFNNLWIGSSDGLNFYDPLAEVFHKFWHIHSDSLSLPSNFISALLKDKDGNLWIGTSNGLAVLKNSLIKEIRNNHKISFSVYKNYPNDSKSISSNNVTAIIQDDNENIWLATQCDGINKFDKVKNYFIHYLPSSQNQKSELVNFRNIKFESNCISALEPDTDNSNYIWIGHIEGLAKFSIDDELFYHAFSSEGLDNLLKNNEPVIVKDPEYYFNSKIISLTKIDKNFLIIGTNLKGMLLFDVNKGNIYPIEIKFNDPNTILYKRILTIFKDKEGIVWLGSSRNGIFKYNTKKNNFYTYLNTFNSKSIFDIENINSVYIDSDNSLLWIGTEDNGLYMYDKEKRVDRNLRSTNTFKQTKKFNNHTVTFIHHSSAFKNYIWLGLYGGGLIKYDKLLDKFEERNIRSPLSEFVKPGPYPVSSYSTYFLTDVAEDHENNLWLTSILGLYKYDIKLDKFTIYKSDPNENNSISQNDLTCILYDKFYKELWIGTKEEGIDRFDLKKKKITNYKHDNSNNNTISNNSIRCLFLDSKGQKWIGTNKGLNKFDDSILGFNRIYKKDGLASNLIQGILEDNKGNLWISTDKGLSKFNTVNESFTNYDINNGLQGNEFNLNSCYKSKSGELFFGGANGLNSFFPDSIKKNIIPPKIVLTDFKLFNVSIKPGEDSPLKSNITYAKNINLNYDQNVFSFHFAALNFSSPQKNKYAYMMEGFDKDWIYTDASQRLASYSNLDPGQYIFRVKGANNDAVWNEKGISISVTIFPPWWATWWAYLIYSLVVILLIIYTTKFYLNRKMLKQSLVLEHEHSKNLLKIDQIKSRFFTNISHEFRTPLTLIKGPAEHIINHTKEEKILNNANLIIRNANKLNKLITSILDISRIESGEMKLNLRILDIIKLLNEIVEPFVPLAEVKKINFQFKTNQDRIYAYLDKEKIEKVMYNILSNAFKFTQKFGEISLAVDHVEENCEIKVSDNGIGISKSEISKIFDRFYQIDNTHKKEHEGTGIGLSLTKELVELHNGRIEVASEEGKGTIFTILLPIGKDHLRPNEIDKNQIMEEELDYSGMHSDFDINIENEHCASTVDSEYIYDEKNSMISNNDKPLILIVEDNSDVRKYLKGFLDQEFQIIEASNGIEGFDKTVISSPDIIVSDIMMPKMDGFQLCQKLKSDESTNHIPLILLTAKAAQNDIIDGLDYGADDYITKPFHEDQLLARIRNLIEQRKKLREYFIQNGIFNLNNVKQIPALDKVFIDRTIKIINDNLSNPEFGLNSFAEKMNMGRTSLHKKILALTGKSPGELIKKLRLDKARKLIKSNFGNISEIALEVGYNNPSYFAECFKKEFGFTPSKYPKNLSVY